MRKLLWFLLCAVLLFLLLALPAFAWFTDTMYSAAYTFTVA